MKPVFRTGSFLTAKNLNLAQRVSGFTGIIEGCDLSVIDTLLLGINSGISKFDDGLVIVFDGNETLDMSSKEDGDYYICVIEYSEHSIVLEAVKALPEYRNIELGTLTKEGRNLTVRSNPKSSLTYVRKYFGIPYIKEYLNSDIEQDENGIRYCLMRVTNTESIDISSGNFNFGFIADSAINNIDIRGLMDSPNHIAIRLYVNGEEKDVNVTLSYWDLNIANGYRLTIPYGYVKANDVVNLKLTLYNASSSEATAKIYEIILN